MPQTSPMAPGSPSSSPRTPVRSQSCSPFRPTPTVRGIGAASRFLRPSADASPIAVLAAIQHGEARSFPYLGNVPVVCWHGKASLPVVVSVLLDEVLRDRYFPERVRAICLQRGISMKHQVFTYPPELFTVLSHRVETLAAGGKLGCYLYPDPPLGAEELRMLRQFDPTIDPVTPTILWAT